ncbi:hypothetical protein CF327_g2505 [Tilletia walkeri]|nr:hypothetical protein CF327_g2505 [Tilletia walkeri]
MLAVSALAFSPRKSIFSLVQASPLRTRLDLHPPNLVFVRSMSASQPARVGAKETSAPPPPAPGAIVLGLERITSLLSRLDNPHARFPVIHFAGTNAKGSTTAYIDTLLTHAVGLRTGRFNSPHLVTERDTCSLNAGSQIIPADIWSEATALVKAADQQDGRLECTPFELLTATAFQAFDLLAPPLRPEILIVEVGLGGALDATNVFPARNVLASVICPVDLDHESLLGSTLQEIASAKAGIIKAGGLCVLADQRRREAVDQEAAPSNVSQEADDLALRASTAVGQPEAEAGVLGQSAATIVSTVARICTEISRTDAAETSGLSQSARLVRAHAPLHVLSKLTDAPSSGAGEKSWQPRIQAKLTMAPTLCTPTAAIQRYDDEDDFAAGGLGLDVKTALSALQDARFVPDPAIHPEAYDEDDEEASNGIEAALLQHSPSYSLMLPATRAALSAASTALTTLHAIARDLPSLIPGSAQRELHSFDPWEDLRLRIAYGMTASDGPEGQSGDRIRTTLERGVRWPGRCEWVTLQSKEGVEEGPGEDGRKVLEPVLLDGAHNPSSASALREYLNACIGTRLSTWLNDKTKSASAKAPKVEITWIMAFSKGKDVRGMLDTLLYSPSAQSEPAGLDTNTISQQLAALSLLSPASASTNGQSASLVISQRVALCPFATPVEGMPWVRPIDPAESAKEVRDLLQITPSTAGDDAGSGQTEVRECDSLQAALEWAATVPTSVGEEETLRLTVICGSLYLVGECYSLADRSDGRLWTIKPL